MNNYTTIKQNCQEKPKQTVQCRLTDAVVTSTHPPAPADVYISFYKKVEGDWGREHFTQSKREVTLMDLYAAIMEPSEELHKKTVRCAELYERVPPEPPNTYKTAKAYHASPEKKHFNRLKAAYSNYKSYALSAVTPNGLFDKQERLKQTLRQATYRMVLDWDGFTSREALLETLKLIREQPFTEFAFISPSGNGIKAIILLSVIVKNDAQFKRAFHQVAGHYNAVTGVEQDKSGKDVSRLCFVAADKNAYFNPDAVPFRVDLHTTDPPLLEMTPQRVSNGKRTTSTTSQKKKAGGVNPDTHASDAAPQQGAGPHRKWDLSADEVNDALKHIDADCDYDGWICIGIVLKRYGYACEMFDHWSATGNTYSGQTGDYGTFTKWATFDTDATPDPDAHKLTMWHLIKRALEGGWTLPKRYARKVRLQLKTDTAYTHKVTSLDEARHTLQTDATAIVGRGVRRGKHIDVFTSFPGTGKSEAFMRAGGTHIAITPTTAMAIEQEQKLLQLGFSQDDVHRRRPRDYNIGRADYETLPFGLGDNERPCIQPTLCNTYAERGRSARHFVCRRCPRVDECWDVGYLSQIEKERNATWKLLPSDLRIVADERLKRRITEIKQPTDILIVDDPDITQLTQFRKHNINDFATMLQRYRLDTPEGCEPDPVHSIITDLLTGMDELISRISEPTDVGIYRETALHLITKASRAVLHEVSIDAMPESQIETEIETKRQAQKRYYDRKLNESVAEVGSVLPIVAAVRAESVDKKTRLKNANERIEREAATTLTDPMDWQLDTETVWVESQTFIRRVNRMKRLARAFVKTDEHPDVDVEIQRLTEQRDAKHAEIDDKHDALIAEAADTIGAERAIRFIEQHLAAIPAWTRIDATDGLHMDIMTAERCVTVRMEGEEYKGSDPHIKLKEAKLDDLRDLQKRNVTGQWTYTPIRLNNALNAGVVEVDNPPIYYAGVFTDFLRFEGLYKDKPNAPASLRIENKGQTKQVDYHYELPPSLNAPNAVFLTGSDVFKMIEQAYAGTEVNVEYHKTPIPAFDDSTRYFQLSTGKYVASQSQVDKDAEGNVTLKPMAENIIDNIVSPAEQAGIKSVVTAQKIWQKTDAGKALAEKGRLYNHAQAVGINELMSRDLIVNFHTEMPPDEIENIAKRMHKHDPKRLSFERGAVEVDLGHSTWKGIGYKDKRVMDIYLAGSAIKHLQTLMRLRPNLQLGKVLINCSSLPIPSLPITPVLFTLQDTETLAEFLTDTPETAFKRWQEVLGSKQDPPHRDEAIKTMRADGKTQTEIADAVGLSQSRVQQILEAGDAAETETEAEVKHDYSTDETHKNVTCAVCDAEPAPPADPAFCTTPETEHVGRGRDPDEPTPHVETSHSKKYQSGLIYIYSETGKTSAVPASTADEGTCPLETSHSTSEAYHKGVEGQVRVLLGDGIERKLGEIVARVDASESAVRKTVRRMLRNETITNPRHGVYQMPAAACDVPVVSEPPASVGDAKEAVVCPPPRRSKPQAPARAPAPAPLPALGANPHNESVLKLLVRFVLGALRSGLPVSETVLGFPPPVLEAVLASLRESGVIVKPAADGYQLAAVPDARQAKRSGPSRE